MSREFVHHHVKYKEIHGIDEIVIMPHNEHRKLHSRLRREGKCNIPTEELQKISVAASQRRLKIEKMTKKNEPNIEINTSYQEKELLKGRVYKTKKGMVLNITGNVSQTRLKTKTRMVVELSENGREIRLKPWVDVEL
jgi:hypothetical protein